jgi:hypothetical protein
MPEASENAKEAPEPRPTFQTFASFLESVGPSQWRHIEDLWSERNNTYGKVDVPELRLHCKNEQCNGVRTFRSSTDVYFHKSAFASHFIAFLCSDCQKEEKTYSVQLMRLDACRGRAYKYGESPTFGFPTPARLIRLFGSDKDYFLKGRQCETHGLGVGAFVYYRRVVESHKDQIFDAIINVSQKVGLDPAKIEALMQAKKEIQFTKGIEAVKDAIPQALLINGHNPLTLMHRALSSHLHEKSDGECLELAHDIRIVMVELAEKIGEALKNEAELSAAVSRLLNPKPDKLSAAGE